MNAKQPDHRRNQWISPQEVVACSLHCLAKKKVVCIPGRMNRIQVFMSPILPESLNYHTTRLFFRKYGWINGK